MKHLRTYALTHLKSAILLFIIMLSFAACKKQSLLTEYKEAEEANLIVTNAVNPSGNTGYCVEDIENTAGYDSVLTPTILGVQLSGYPYSVSIMQQAAQQILGTSAGVAVNAKYMRFKPANADQLAALEDNDIDLFDYPLDYELVQEGDYYDDGTSTSPENIPWLYAVVPVDFTAPAGVTSELIQQIHVPNDYRVEKKAFELTGNYVDDVACPASESLTGGNGENWVPQCPDVCNPSCSDYDPNLCTGGGGNPGPITGVRIPAGTITVTDDIRTANPLQPLRKARVVAKRFLKVERTFTNDNGQYQFTKSFRNKVKLIVKFKNNDAVITGMKGLRYWQMIFPVKINLGTFRGNLNNITRNIDDNNDPKVRGARHWAAATTHNCVQEYHQFATALNIGLPPQKTRILLSTSRYVSGSAPMYAKRFVAQLPITYLKHFIIGTVSPPAELVNACLAFLKSRVDIAAGYNLDGNTTRNSAELSEQILHELTHAAHYNKVGNSWYNEFVEAEFSEIILGTVGLGERPYGDGMGIRSGYIGVGEGWAYYMGHLLTNRKYTIGTTAVNMWTFEQGLAYQNDGIHEIANNIIVTPAVAFTGLNAHLNLLEDFSPIRTNDPFAWIPQGLFYDLTDNRDDFLQNPRRVPLNDGVSSYTNQELFNAIDDDITTMPAYRVRLLQENLNRDAAGVTTIFSFYNF